MSLPSELAGTPVAEHSLPRGLQVYRSLHLWLGIGLIITSLGFTPTYFMAFTEASWLQHVHGITATMWMLLLVVQPWLATRGHLPRHRTLGVIALVLAGMVVASGLTALPGNIEGAMTADTHPLAPPTFLYGITFADLVTISGFLVAVLMATLSVRRLDDHVIWMASTVFWVLMPALARLVGGTLFASGMLGERSLIDVVFWTTFPIVGALIVLMVRLRRAHPALVLVALGNLSPLLVGPVGNSEAWRAICQALFI